LTFIPFKNYYLTKLALAGIFILVLVSYLVWEIYWYNQVELAFVKWHTHLMLFVYLWGAFFFIQFLFFRDIKFVFKKNLSLVFIAVTSTLFVVEFVLSVGGYTKTYLEKCTGSYISVHPLKSQYHRKWPPNSKHDLRTPEFSFVRNTNSLGFSDREWDAQSSTNTTRILALGDSFTEGDGAPFDSSYVAFLSKRMQVNGHQVYCMNAGVCGNDPFFDYINLRDKLITYHPDIVIQTISSNDLLTDLISRGGMERFQKDGTVKYFPAPWWEPIYAVSHISRYFFRALGYNELLLKNKITLKQKELLNRQFVDLLKQYESFCKKNNICFVLVLRPDRLEVERKNYLYDFSVITDSITGGSIQFLDLMPAYLTHIKETGKTPSNFYWTIDGHHNWFGYKMMADVIEGFVTSKKCSCNKLFKEEKNE
jgi:lysophospholipase L1-like esterase